MSPKPYFLLLLSAVLLLLRPALSAVKYRVIDTLPTTAGGARFESEIGVPFTLSTMKTINFFIWKILRQPTTADRKPVPLLTINITTLNRRSMAETGGDTVYVDWTSIEAFPAGRARYWFASLLYHEMTHIFQWSGRGTAPGGLTEGVADYVMVKSGYYDPATYDKPGDGKRWDEGYGVTARFLEYCDGLRDGFTAELNNKMREVYKDEYFEEILGKPLKQVWREYKKKYGKEEEDINY